MYIAAPINAIYLPTIVISDSNSSGKLAAFDAQEVWASATS